MTFKILKKDKSSLARLGRIETNHGVIKTPFFMPIATMGAVKTLDPRDLEELDTQIILSNTYHLMLRPGVNLIKRTSGLHKFINWSKPILTDSGGYQVFSLSKSRKIVEKGVEFSSDIDGRKYLLTPEKSIDIQLALGSDIMMCLDECVAYPCKKEYAAEAMERTTRWAERSQKSKIPASPAGRKNQKSESQALFSIVQGSVYKDLRLESARNLVNLDFDGYAIGGLAVGEPRKKMYQVLDYLVPELPENKPRYLMGIGKPEEIIKAVKKGIDMFDCVIPTRNARHGVLYKFKVKSSKLKVRLFSNSENFYEIIRIKNKKYKNNLSPIDPNCHCYTCQNFSRAYLRHLFMVKEPLAQRLATIHNLSFYLEMMKGIRKVIRD